MSAQKQTSAAIRARLSHPIVDSDGHWIEYGPAALEYLKELGGPSLVERYRKVSIPYGSGARKGTDDRRDRRTPQVPWWAATTRTLDRATAILPKLLYERLDEFGIDFGVLYPSAVALFAPSIRDEEVRRAACRAFNNFVADTFKDLSDRLTAVAGIPMHTPQEAIDELEHAKQVGFKAVCLASLIRRPIPAVEREMPQAMRYGSWFDNLALDSEYDYDPVWAKCIELGFAPTFHTGSQGFGFRTSISNWVYNHIGHFANGGDPVCKALFLGGVTRRFPQLKFAFMEGGVSWGCRLYTDLIGHWRTRNLEALVNVDPDRLDRDKVAELFDQYGTDVMKRTFEKSRLIRDIGRPPANRDDFRYCEIKRAEDIRDLFVPHFYFGCEAEEPTNAWAFNSRVNPFGARFNAIFGSDIGHFDVVDMSEVVAEAHELVEHELINEEDFRDFMFANAVRFWTHNNPDFFKGTVVESAATKLLAEGA
jgi:predicted TIM-barrel fold metal-dependent hydrolase